MYKLSSRSQTPCLSTNFRQGSGKSDVGFHGSEVAASVARWAQRRPDRGRADTTHFD
jgi:hypothetical protein